MPIAPRRPHKSWYRQFWYADRSPRDTLVDRTLIFAIAALTLLAGGMLLARHGATPRTTDPMPAAEVAR
jgi:hypothetical protein